MCSTNNSALVPYGLKIANGAPGSASGTSTGTVAPMQYGHPFAGGISQAAFELHRAQLMEYSARLRYGIPYGPMPAHGLGGPFHPNPQDPLAFIYGKHDPRARFLHEEPKPSHSYIGLISMAILSSKEKKLVLSDIYQWILDNYTYFRTRGPGWRNSIRHNLSLNDCFIKSGRSANGKGHYWAIHPANIEDFKKGDFRRRRAQRKVRKAMGMAVPDDEDSPSPPPSSAAVLHEWQTRMLQGGAATNTASPDGTDEQPSHSAASPAGRGMPPHLGSPGGSVIAGGSGLLGLRLPTVPVSGKRRLFDVESLLAPDSDRRFTLPRMGIISPSQSESSTSGAAEAATAVLRSPADKISQEGDKDIDSSFESDVSATKEGEDDKDEMLIDVDEVTVEDEDGDVNVHDDDNKDSPADQALDSAAPPASPVSGCGCSAQDCEGSRSKTVSDRLDSDGDKRALASQHPPFHSPKPSDTTPEPGHAHLASSLSPHQVQSGQHPLATAGWPMGVPLPTWPQDRASAFHSALPSNVAAAYGLHPHAYPLVAAPYTLQPTTTLQNAADSAQKWQETFSKIMARSYDNKNVKLQS